MGAREDKRVALIVGVTVGLFVLCAAGVFGYGALILSWESKLQSEVAAEQAAAEAERARRHQQWLDALPEEHRAGVLLLEAAQEEARRALRAIVAGEPYAPDPEGAATLRNDATAHGTIEDLASSRSSTVESVDGVTTGATVGLDVHWSDASSTAYEFSLEVDDAGAWRVTKIESP